MLQKIKVQYSNSKVWKAGGGFFLLFYFLINLRQRKKIKAESEPIKSLWKTHADDANM